MASNVMQDTLLLTKVGILNGFGVNKLKKGAPGRGKNIAIIITVAISALFLYTMMFLIFYISADTLKSMGLESQLLTAAFGAMTVPPLIFTLYKGSGFLFKFGDFSLLFSLPVSYSSILISKLVMLYISNMFVTLLMALPALLAYGLIIGVSVAYWPMALVLLILAPLVPMVLGSLISILITGISTRFKYSNVISIVLALACVIGTIVISMSLSSVDPETALDGLSSTANVMNVYLPSIWFTNALAETNALNFFSFVLLYVGVFGLFVFIIAKAFRNINSALSETHASSNYKMKSLTTNSPLKALYLKELKTYFGSFSYVLNTGVGTLMLTAAGIAVFLFGEQTIAQIMNLSEVQGTVALTDMFVPMAALVALFCCGLSCTTAASISIEGNNLWISQSLPISFEQFLLSKVLVSLTIALPLLPINTILFAVGLNMSIQEAFVFFVGNTAFTIFVSFMGFTYNLLFPKLDWKSQMEAVKQGTSVLCNVFTIIGLILFLGFAFAFTGLSFVVFGIIATLVFLLATVALWFFLKYGGKTLFEKINS